MCGFSHIDVRLLSAAMAAQYKMVRVGVSTMDVAVGTA